MITTEDYFVGFDWTKLTIINVQLTHYREAGVVRHFTKAAPLYQLSLRKLGKVDIHYNGRYLKTYENTVIYLPKEKSGVVDYTHRTLEPADSICIFFESAAELPSEPFLLDCDGFPKVTEYFLKLLNQYKTDTMNGGLESISSFYRLLAALHKLLAVRSDTSQLRERLSPTVQFIESHYREQYIDIGSLAASVGMSSDHFRRCFSNVYGMSPLKYINSYRLEQAKLLLSEGYPVASIAEAVGIPNANYFSRIFRERVGISPSTFAGNR